MTLIRLLFFANFWGFRYVIQDTKRRNENWSTTEISHNSMDGRLSRFPVSLAAHLVKIWVRPVNVKVWLVNALDCSLKWFVWLQKWGRPPMENIQNSQSGKMSEELSAQAKAKTSDVCWKDLHTSSSQMFQFLDLQGRTESGQNLEQFPAMDGLLHGDCSMLNTGESPSVARESRLSWILEDNVPQKFYLSAQACQGILVRASRRGKPLLELLKQALLDMIEWWTLQPTL